MSKGLIFLSPHGEKQVEITTKEPTIEQQVIALDVGESVKFPISRKTSVCGRVSDLNKEYDGKKVWRTKTNRIEFEVLVIREK